MTEDPLHPLHSSIMLMPLCRHSKVPLAHKNFIRNLPSAFTTIWNRHCSLWLSLYACFPIMCFDYFGWVRMCWLSPVKEEFLLYGLNFAIGWDGGRWCFECRFRHKRPLFVIVQTGMTLDHRGRDWWDKTGGNESFKTNDLKRLHVTTVVTHGQINS